MADHAASSVAEIASAAATKTTYVGGGASVVGVLASIDWLALAGFFIAVAGFLLNAYFQYKRNKREELESLLRIKREQDIHELEMKRLEGRCDVKQD